MKKTGIGKSSLGFVCGVLSALWLLAGQADAQTGHQTGDRKFLGHDITLRSGVYLVTKDANVRTGPKTSFKRIGSVRRGSNIDVVGKAKGGAGWMAMRRDGKDFGFVYAPVLLPLLDGSPEKDITGRVMIKGRPPCRYTIRFQGRTVLEQERISFADYEVEYRCTDGGKAYLFYAPMFITEVPYRLTHDPVYQISIDLLGMDDDPDNIFSTVFMYRRDEDLITFDSFSKAAMGRKPRHSKRPARNVTEALVGVVETAPTAWTKGVWSKLARLFREDG